MAISSVGATARNYVDLAASLAALPATLTEQEVAELYNDAEFTSASQITISGITTTPTFNLVIRAATGEGFNDTEQALRYNQANGVAVRKTSSYGAIISNAVNYTLIEDIQFSTTSTNNTIGFISSAIDYINDCIIDSSSNVRVVSSSTGSSTFLNSIIIANENSSTGTEGLLSSYVATSLFNCTLISLFPGSTAFGVEKQGGAANSSVVKNTAIFGFGTAIETGTWGAGTDYNGTDDATLPAGSNNQTSLTLANQFENVASAATLDLRLKAGNSLDSNGTPDSVNTNDLDIFGNARSLTAPSIGAYETVSGGGGFQAAWAMNANKLLNWYN